MKKIVLRMSDLTLHNEDYGKLSYASFYTIEGEVTAFLGLNYSGKELLVQILTGHIDMNWSESRVYVDGCRIRKFVDLQPLIYYLNTNCEGIENWSVAEYISLKDVSWFLSRKARENLIKQAEQRIEKINVQLNVKKKLRDLTPLERRIVEVIRAEKENARILIIEDECEGMDIESIQKYSDFLKTVIQGKMSVILLCHSTRAAEILSDEYVIFRRGRIVKRWKKNSSYNTGKISDYLLGGTMRQKKNSLDSYARKITPLKKIVYEVNYVFLKDRKENFYFHKGEITTFVITEHRMRQRLFQILSGRISLDGVEYTVQNKKIYSPSILKFFEYKIVSVMRLGNDNEIFEKMSVGDNLMLPSLKKIPLLNYMISGHKIKEILSNEFEIETVSSGRITGCLGKNDHISVAMDRWYIFNPDVIILYEPFTSCDAYGVSVILSYVKKMADKGTSIIIVKSNSEYMEECSDRIIDLDEIYKEQ